MSEIHRVVIDLDHPNARNAQAFLNSWEEPFVPVEGKKFVYRSVLSNTMVRLLFFETYEDADTYGATHLPAPTEKRKWNLNGAMLYAVNGDNADKVSSLVSHFAGRE